MYKRFQITKVLSLIAVLFTVSACIDLEPDSAFNFLGEEHTFTATVVDPIGGEDPLFNVLLTFTVTSGPNEGRTSVPFSGECVPDDCRTNEIGQVSWTYSSDVVGIDSIVATTNVNDEDIPSDTVIKFWQAAPRPIPTLSQWGLIAMAGILGIVGFIVIRKRNLTA